MTKRDAISVALKIMGILSITGVIVFIPVAFIIAKGPFLPEGPIMFWYYVAIFAQPVFGAAVGFVLLKYSEAIAGKLISEDKKIDIGLSDDWDRSALTVALRVVGLTAAIKGTVNLIQSGVYFAVRSNVDVQRMIQWDRIVVPCTLIFIGIYLIAGGKMILRFAFRKPRERLLPGPLVKDGPVKPDDEYEI
jgi:hypothetical protein